MGMRFDLRSANWVAYLIEPHAQLPRLDGEDDEILVLRHFLEHMGERFLASPSVEHQLRGYARHALHNLHDLLDETRMRGEVPERALRELRVFFRERDWTALIVPSGQDWETDRFLCSREFLDELVSIRCDDPGLILQVEDVAEGPFALTDVFPAFKTALAQSTHWPGILLWTMRGDSVFLPFGTGNRRAIRDRAHWMFSHLATALRVDVRIFRGLYNREFPDAAHLARNVIHFIHISDLHIGCRQASVRIPRVQQLIRCLVEELDDGSQVVPVVSGDVMDSPDDRNLDGVRSFLSFLQGMGTSQPIMVLGNHDVRRDGFLDESLRQALTLPTSNVVWFDQSPVGLICVNSVVAGHLARGRVGERQMLDIGNTLDVKGKVEEQVLLCVLHHHPTPVERPEWFSAPFYERLLGRAFEATLALEDADEFLTFAHKRRFAAVLHGHKHIPRVGNHDGMPLAGCGSTVGKVDTTDGRTYMSLNVVSLDAARSQLSIRLLAERIPGGGLVETRRHEIVYRRPLNPNK